MQSRALNKPILILGGLIVTMCSGCATALMRSEDSEPVRHVYPATAFDAEFFWSSGIMGEPLFAMSDSKYRNDPVIRLTVMLGSIVDLPFSVVTDTVLLPFDWKAAGAANQTNGEPAIRENRRQASRL